MTEEEYEYWQLRLNLQPQTLPNLDITSAKIAQQVGIKWSLADSVNIYSSLRRRWKNE